jgi:predicted permease
VNAVLLVLPDFALIAAGFVLARGMRLDPAFWAGAEKLTYFVLFPALLFHSNARQPLDVGTAGPMLLTVLAAIAAGIVLGLAGRALFRPSPPVFGAAFQCHFRFNSYIALAAASRLGGDQGLGLMALAIGVAVPFVNVAAVWGLARGNPRHVAREIATNPLVLSCVLGIAWGALRLPMPDLLAVTLSRLGAAALVIGLLAIGAALTPRLPRGTSGFVAWTLAVKLLALPVVALAVARSLGLSGEAFRIALVFAALPTAPAAYILTVRLGGDGRTAAALVTLSVIASLVTLPMWLALAG